MAGLIFILIMIGMFSGILDSVSSVSQSSSSSSSYNSTPRSYKTTPLNDSTTAINIKSQHSPPSISASPRSISSSPSIRLSLIDGQYRTFENHYVNGVQYTFGFPKYECKDRRVWVGIDKMEIERISMSEANRRIKQKNHVGYSNKIRSIGYSNSYGYCNRCNKKLRGDRSKKNCYACWKSGYR